MPWPGCSGRCPFPCRVGPLAHGCTWTISTHWAMCCCFCAGQNLSRKLRMLLICQGGHSQIAAPSSLAPMKVCDGDISHCIGRLKQKHLFIELYVAPAWRTGQPRGASGCCYPSGTMPRLEQGSLTPLATARSWPLNCTTRQEKAVRKN